MANTNALSKIVEPFVRNFFSKKFKEKIFNHDVSVQLTTGGKHKFDLVSLDGYSIIADIKSSSARRNIKSSRKIGAGPFRSAIVDLYYLTLVSAKNKFLVLTNKDFFDFFVKRMVGKIPDGISVIYCELPEKIKKEIDYVLFNAKTEIGKK